MNLSPRQEHRQDRYGDFGNSLGRTIYEGSWERAKTRGMFDPVRPNYSDSEIVFFIPLARFSESCAMPRAVAHPAITNNSKRPRMAIDFFLMVCLHATGLIPVRLSHQGRMPPRTQLVPSTEISP